MNPVDYFELLRAMLPQAILAVAALLVLFVDLAMARALSPRGRWLLGAGIAGLGCVAAAGWLGRHSAPAKLFGGVLIVDPVVAWVQVGLLILTFLTILISAEADFTPHIGEYFALVLMGAIGLLFLAASEDLLTLFVSLELASLSLYLLTAFHPRQPAAAEAALKYFLFGSVAAAFMLFGFSLLYGLTGSLNLRAIASSLAGRGLEPLLAMGLVTTLMGLGFKVAAVPFHLWAPDAYQGAPSPAAALIAGGSKLASFFLFARVMVTGFAGVEGSADWGAGAAGWMPLVAIMAVVSMLLGNLAALAQANVKRLIAYSAVAHAGYLLIGLLALGRVQDRTALFASIVYYAFTYGLTVVGVFGVIHAMERRQSGVNLEDFDGLARKSPWLAGSLLVFLLSLAGIPPLAGFFGKFYVFLGALQAGAAELGLLWLVCLALAASALSLYYYLLVLKHAYVAVPPTDRQSWRLSALEHLAISGIAAGVVLAGVFPQALIGLLLNGLRSAGY